MRAKGGVLEMKGGKEVLTFLGPGGYKIEWSPGTIHHKRVQAPSGHLVIPCGNFFSSATLSPVGGVTPPVSALTVEADPVRAAVSLDLTPPGPDPIETAAMTTGCDGADLPYITQ